MAFTTCIHMSVPDSKGNAVSVTVPDLIDATQLAMESFAKGFTSLRYNDCKATHLWTGINWITTDEARRLKQTFSRKKFS